MAQKQKTVVVGAGPVGALAAIYAAHRGDDVAVYEFRNDLRDPSTPLLNFTRSINLALSERGINAMRSANQPGLLDTVMAETLPMQGRMLHRRTKAGELFEEGQNYDIHGRTIFAADRSALNKTLLNTLESMPNVTLHFNHKLVGANFKANKAWFQRQIPSSAGPTPAPLSTASQPPAAQQDEIEVSFDFLIGADGAHSSVRYHLMKYVRMSYAQEYIDTLWCEFLISPKDPANIYPSVLSDPDAKFKLSPHYLHIWPSHDFMFIAIPSLDGSFTCTLFLPSSHYTLLESDPDTLVPAFFNQNFPGVTQLIPPDDLITQFKSNPHLPLISLKCTPYHSSNGSAVILGDAAHAMVPFYGQGMNAGLEDVRILYSILDAHPSTTEGRTTALEQYTATRHPSSLSITKMAQENYHEMASHVTSPLYKFRKRLEEWLSVHVPGLGWQTRYSRVSFGNLPYEVVYRLAEEQGRWISWGVWTVGVLGMVGLGATGWVVGRRRGVNAEVVVEWMKRLGGFIGGRR